MDPFEGKKREDEKGKQDITNGASYTVQLLLKIASVHSRKLNLKNEQIAKLV